MECHVKYLLLMQASVVLVVCCSCSRGTSSDSPTTEQSGQGGDGGAGDQSNETKPGADVDVSEPSGVPQPKQVGPSGSPGNSGDGGDEGYVRPDQVFLDGWLASHVVTGHFTGSSSFSESTLGPKYMTNAFEVVGFTDYDFIPDRELSLAFPSLAVTRCSLTDPTILGTSDAATISKVSVHWGNTQVIDAGGEPHPIYANEVSWTEPAVPKGVMTGGQVLLLLDAYYYPQLWQADVPREIRYILTAVFAVDDGLVYQADSTTLTLEEIATTAEARMTEARKAQDAKIACTKHPEKYPTWPGYSDPSCRSTDCDVPVEEVENP